MIQLNGNIASLQIDEFTPEMYQQFLNVKTLPRYTFRQNGRGYIAEFPAEYSERFGVDYAAIEQTLPLPLPDFLFDRQVVAIKVAWKKRRYALFWDAGLGKTLVFLELARQAAALGQKSIIISPLNIISQTVETAMEFYGAEYPHIVNLHSRKHYKGDGPNNVRAFAECDDFQIAIINHATFRKPIDLSSINNVFLDESAILKNPHGTLRTNMIDACKGILRKYAFSATQAPNARIEYAQIAVWLEVVRSDTEFQAMFFVQKDKGWVLRHHRKRGFYDFLASFSMFMRDPAVYGFEDNLNLVPYVERTEKIEHTPGQVALINELIDKEQIALPGIPHRPRTFRERQLYNQVSKGFAYRNDGDGTVYVGSNEPAAIRRFIQAHPGQKAIVWTAFDEEEKILRDELTQNTDLYIIVLTGKTPVRKRIEIIDNFRHGRIDVLISKPRLLGLGLNLHVASLCIFSSLQDSFEQFYQALKRLWRYPQDKQVIIYLPYTIYEYEILVNVLRKRDVAIKDFETQEKLYFESGYDEIRQYLETDAMPTQRKEKEMHEPIVTDKYEIYHTDSIADMLSDRMENSIDLIVTSIPFRNDLFAYTDSVSDMGNSGGVGELGKHEFMTHLKFCLEGMYRALKPGRICAIEISQSPLRKGIDGIIGMSDFRGDVIDAGEAVGFFQLGEWAVVGNPQAEAIVKHITTLSIPRLSRDRSFTAPMILDYIIIMKKPGINEVPIKSPEVSNENWIEYADGVALEQEFNRDATMSTAVSQRARYDSVLAQYDKEYRKVEEFFKLMEAKQNSGQMTREEIVMQFMGTFYDISQTDTLNTPYTRGVTKELEDADKHVCPFSLPLVNRLIRLYSNPGEIILDPFGGVGSVAKEAIELRRFPILIELKAEYFLQSVKVAEQATETLRQETLFDFAGVTV
jgi:DNA modification methylase